MGERSFTLAARIRTTDPVATRTALTTIFPNGVVTPLAAHRVAVCMGVRGIFVAQPKRVLYLP
jgi:hypothetical protein